jgi:hypothetical protein
MDNLSSEEIIARIAEGDNNSFEFPVDRKIFCYYIKGDFMGGIA